MGDQGFGLQGDDGLEPMRGCCCCVVFYAVLFGSIFAVIGLVSVFSGGF